MNGRYDDECGGIDIWADSNAPSSEYGASRIDYCNHTPYYQYEFKNEEALVASKIFQKHLGMGLAHKDKIIRELQEEILNGKQWID